MANEATFSVTGYVATPPRSGWTRDGTRTLYMRVGWTPRRIDKRTGEWADQATSFVSVTCYRKVAENAAACLRRGDPIVLKGTLRVREYGDDKRVTVDVFADSIGHDLSRGVTIFKKSTEQLEQTALEREREMAGAGRAPLYGDQDASERTGQPDGGQPGAGQPGARQLDSEVPDPETPDLEGVSDSDVGEAFNEEEAMQMLAQADESAEPVSVPA